MDTAKSLLAAKYFPELHTFEWKDSFSCAWNKDGLCQGKLHVTATHLAFYANMFGKIIKLVIIVADIKLISKKFTAGVIPNALRIVTDAADYTFINISKRDAAYDLIHLLSLNSKKSSSTTSKAELTESLGNPGLKEDSFNESYSEFDSVTGESMNEEFTAPPKPPRTRSIIGLASTSVKSRRRTIGETGGGIASPISLFFSPPPSSPKEKRMSVLEAVPQIDFIPKKNTVIAETDETKILKVTESESIKLVDLNVQAKSKLIQFYLTLQKYRPSSIELKTLAVVSVLIIIIAIASYLRITRISIETYTLANAQLQKLKIWHIDQYLTLLGELNTQRE